MDDHQRRRLPPLITAARCSLPPTTAVDYRSTATDGDEWRAASLVVIGNGRKEE